MIVHAVNFNSPVANHQVHIGGIPDVILEAARKKILDYLRTKYGDQDFDSQVYLESFKHVQWNDTSLGCPEEGKEYTQVTTPGYEIKFSVGNGWITVHSNADLENIQIVSSKFQNES